MILRSRWENANQGLLRPNASSVDSIKPFSTVVVNILLDCTTSKFDYTTSKFDCTTSKIDCTTSKFDCNTSKLYAVQDIPQFYRQLTMKKLTVKMICCLEEKASMHLPFYHFRKESESKESVSKENESKES